MRRGSPASGGSPSWKGAKKGSNHSTVPMICRLLAAKWRQSHGVIAQCKCAPGLGQGGGVDEGRFPVWALARLAWAQAVVGEVLVGGPLGRMPRQGCFRTNHLGGGPRRCRHGLAAQSGGPRKTEPPWGAIRPARTSTLATRYPKTKPPPWAKTATPPPFASAPNNP